MARRIISEFEISIKKIINFVRLKHVLEITQQVAHLYNSQKAAEFPLCNSNTIRLSL